LGKLCASKKRKWIIDLRKNQGCKWEGDDWKKLILMSQAKERFLS
jgi:hypothetical protein